jgi:hypothetical protein
MKFNPKLWVESFAVNMVAEYTTPEQAKEAMKDYLLPRLKHYMPENIAWAIQTDFLLWGHIPPRLKVALEKFAAKESTKKQYEKYGTLVTAEELLKWISEGTQKWPPRLDLASTIENYPDGKGMKWVEKNISELRTTFESLLKK